MAERNTTPIVSVIIPTFNRPELLSEALKSVLSQTFTSFEAIIINDAGIDVKHVVESFNDPRLIYITNKTNQGLSAARNRGIQVAKGKYIAYLDDDDAFFPEHLAILTTILMNSTYRAAYTDWNYIYKKIQNQQVISYDTKPGYSFPFDRQRLLAQNLMIVNCVMHEKSCLDASGLFNENLDRAEDWDLWIRISRNCPFVHIPLVTAQYGLTENNNQMVTNWKGFYLNSILKIHAWYRNEIMEEAMHEHAINLRKQHFYQSFEELKQMSDERIEQLNPNKIMEEIAVNSILNEPLDIKGAQILVGYILGRFPQKSTLWRLYAKLSQLLGEKENASIAISRATLVEETQGNS